MTESVDHLFFALSSSYWCLEHVLHSLWRELGHAKEHETCTLQLEFMEADKAIKKIWLMILPLMCGL